MAPFQCLPESITTKKTWPYYERYHGEKDEDNRRSGQGEYYWSNAESLESYEGPFFRDTMHGWGTYRWRWLGEDGDHVAYEGYFFANKMHGYGSMSYPDGRTFLGLFCNDLRWGPGITRHANRTADVGVWRGNQLYRLAWRPPIISLVPEIALSPTGQRYLEKFRIVLFDSHKTIGETNSALDLLKQQGVPPTEAGELWPKVYSKYCTDMESVLCNKNEFYKSYYGETVRALEDMTPEHMGSVNAATSLTDAEHAEKKQCYFAWNNDPVMLHMMKHAFQHEQQRPASMLDLSLLLSGPRQRLPTPGKHELDCRVLLLASFMGDKSGVLTTIQENNVHPNVSDMLGNTAIMYATCGNQTEIIHLLVEAGAHIDTFNDSCFTPLGVALLIYALTKYDVPLAEYGNVLVATSSFVLGIAITDWLITRSHPAPLPQSSSYPKAAFSQPTASMRKIKSQASMRAISSMLTKKRQQSKKVLTQGTFTSATDLDSAEGILYRSLLHEYEMRISTIAQALASPRYPKNLFEVRNMLIDAEALKVEEDLLVSKTNTGSTKGSRSAVNKNIKSTQKIKTVQESVKWHHSDKDDKSIGSADSRKADSLNHIGLTILHLLLDGANPRLVQCPQPALVTAIVAGSTEIVSHLIRYGADANERYPQLFNYTPLQVAVSRQFSWEALDVTKVLLENGARANDRLCEIQHTDDALPVQGPTLLHALIGRVAATEEDEKLRRRMMELLLEHGCDAYAFYEGRSAIDYVTDQSLDLLDVFINNDTVSLNCATNSSSQSMLAKLLSAQCFRQLPPSRRLQTLTNVVIFGADPLLPVKHEEETYANIFVYAQHELAELKALKVERKPAKANKKSEMKIASGKKKSMLDKHSGSRVTNISSEVDEVEDYEQAIEMVSEFARQLQIRWIQAKLVKELIQLILSIRAGKPWHIIMREYQNEERATLWLTAPRCLEIWNIMKQARHPYTRSGALRPLLAIVQYYHEKHLLSPKLIFKEKDAIDRYVEQLILQPKVEIPGRWPWHPRFTTPELSSPKANKFKICFECSLPLTRERIECVFCNLVFFCNWECMSKNTRRLYCHPCSQLLIDKYFQRAPVGGELGVITEVQEEASEMPSERIILQGER